MFFSSSQFLINQILFFSKQKIAIIMYTKYVCVKVCLRFLCASLEFHRISGINAKRRAQWVCFNSLKFNTLQQSLCFGFSVTRQTLSYYTSRTKIQAANILFYVFLHVPYAAIAVAIATQRSVTIYTDPYHPSETDRLSSAYVCMNAFGSSLSTSVSHLLTQMYKLFNRQAILARSTTFDYFASNTGAHKTQWWVSVWSFVRNVWRAVVLKQTKWRIFIDDLCSA